MVFPLDRKLICGLGSEKSVFLCVADRSCGEVFSATYILFCFASYFRMLYRRWAALCC